MYSKAYRLDVALSKQDYDPDNRVTQEDAVHFKGNALNNNYPEICHNLEVLIQKEAQSFPASQQVQRILPAAYQLQSKATGFPIVDLTLEADSVDAINNLMIEIGLRQNRSFRDKLIANNSIKLRKQRVSKLTSNSSQNS